MAYYRIALIIVGRPNRQYYHLECTEQMLDLSALASTRFTFDPDIHRWYPAYVAWPWGLMVRKCFELKGCVNLDSIVD